MTDLTNTLERLACQAPDTLDLFTDPDPETRLAAAYRCKTCPVAQDCLDKATQLHLARAAGRDLWGVYGVRGGYWFEPGQPPEQIKFPEPQRRLSPAVAQPMLPLVPAAA